MRNKLDALKWVAVAILASAVAVAAILLFATWSTDLEARQKEEKQQNVLECIERTDDPDWCVEFVYG